MNSHGNEIDLLTPKIEEIFEFLLVAAFHDKVNADRRLPIAASQFKKTEYVSRYVSEASRRLELTVGFFF